MDSSDSNVEEIWGDSGPRKWFPMPRGLDKTLLGVSSTEFLLLQAIFSVMNWHLGPVKMTNRTLRSYCGVTKQGVYKCIKNLLSKGLLAKTEVGYYDARPVRRLWETHVSKLRAEAKVKKDNETKKPTEVQVPVNKVKNAWEKHLEESRDE